MKQTKIPILASVLTICALAMGFAGPLSNSAQAQYTFRADCHGPNGVPSWSHTGSNIYLEVYVSGSGWTTAWRSDGKGLGAGPVSSSFCDGELELGGSLGPFMASGMITKLRIRTEGDDVVWFDYIKLTDNARNIVYTWGVNGGAGYCISLEAADGSSSCWNGAAYSAIDFPL